MGYRPSRMHFGLAQIAEAKGDLTRARQRVPGGRAPGAGVRRRKDGAREIRRVISSGRRRLDLFAATRTACGFGDFEQESGDFEGSGDRNADVPNPRAVEPTRPT